MGSVFFFSNYRANRLYKRKGTQKYKFVSVKAYNKEKASLPADVRRSKTPLLKLPILSKSLEYNDIILGIELLKTSITTREI